MEPKATNECPIEPERFYSGQICKIAGVYVQVSDKLGDAPGEARVVHMHADTTFPPSLNNHHFELLRAKEK